MHVYQVDGDKLGWSKGGQSTRGGKPTVKDVQPVVDRVEREKETLFEIVIIKISRSSFSPFLNVKK